MEWMTVDEFKRDVLENKEKYLGRVVVAAEKGGFLVGIIKDADERGLKIVPLLLFREFEAAEKFARMLAKTLEREGEKSPGYIM